MQIWSRSQSLSSGHASMWLSCFLLFGGGGWAQEAQARVANVPWQQGTTTADQHPSLQASISLPAQLPHGAQPVVRANSTSAASSQSYEGLLNQLGLVSLGLSLGLGLSFGAWVLHTKQLTSSVGAPLFEPEDQLVEVEVDSSTPGETEVDSSTPEAEADSSTPQAEALLSEDTEPDLEIEPASTVDLLQTNPLAALSPELANLVDTLPGIVFLRQVGPDAPIRFLSEGCKLITGFSASELLTLSLPTYNSLIVAEDRIRVLEAISIAFQQHQPYHVEYRITHKSGNERWLSEKGQISTHPHYENHFVGLVADITSNRQVEEKLRVDAFHDQLTGLPNRSLFVDRLGQAVRRVRRYPNNRFAVLFVDLDRFKVVNDSLGHLIGDHLLRHVAQRLQACLRPTDTVARLGGDEFTVLLEEVKDSNDAIIVAERILHAISLPFQLEGHEIFNSASLGIAFSRAEYQSPDELLRDADIALYKAKGAGKGRYAIFEPQMRPPAIQFMRLGNDLRRALDRDELKLYYQPIVFLETGNIAGVEALLRWEHPERGLVLPHEFMPVAEETGMLLAIDEWVLHHACQQLNHWSTQLPTYPLLSMSVNLSNHQFMQSNAVETIQLALEHTGLAGNRLQLEINERVIIHNSESVARKLQRLQEMGIQVSLDDFGTGYSSLSYLHQFPVNRLKVDRAFIKAVHTRKNLAIVHTIIDLAHHLGMDVVAEGVETGAQLAQIKAFACEYGQGFWFGKPLSAMETTALLATQNPLCDPPIEDQYSIPQLKVFNPTGDTYIPLVGKAAWKIGRSRDSSIFLSDRWVSQEHAILQSIGQDDIYLVDLTSRNGSYVNGQQLQAPVLLQAGDRVKIGQTAMEFQYVAPPDSTPVNHVNAEEVTNAPPLPQKIKTVLMLQSNQTEGQIWQEILMSQGIFVIWPDGASYPLALDSNWLVAQRAQPDLLLLDLTLPEVDAYSLIQDYRKQYPNLQVILTDSLRSHIDPLNRAWVIRQGILDVLPRFPVGDNESFNYDDVVDRVSLALGALQFPSINREALTSTLLKLQQVFRRETLS